MCGRGGGKARGLARERAGAAGNVVWLCFYPALPPAPQNNNKVGVVVRMEEFDEDLS